MLIHARQMLYMKIKCSNNNVDNFCKRANNTTKNLLKLKIWSQKGSKLSWLLNSSAIITIIKSFLNPSKSIVLHCVHTHSQSTYAYINFVFTQNEETCMLWWPAKYYIAALIFLCWLISDLHTTSRKVRTR